MKHNGVASIRLITEKVLRREAKNGRTTLSGASAMCMRVAETNPGMYGKALMTVALHHLFKREVTQQLKRGMPPNAALGIVPHCPPEVLRRLPQWLAQGEGKDAEWVYAPSATVANWEANAELKEKKATQTLKAAEDPRYIARYLREHGYNSLMAIEHG